MIRGLSIPGLTFDDPSFEGQWRDNNFRRSLTQVRIATAIACVIYSSYGAADRIILPPEMADTDLWLQRTVIASLIGLLFFSTFFRWFEKVWQWLLLGGMMATVGGLTWMWIVLNASIYWYYHNGLVLILIFGFLLLRLTFRFTLLAGAMTMAVFIFMATFVRPAPEINLVSGTSLFFVTLIGLFVSYVMESTERKVYQQNALIQEQRLDLEKSFSELEATQGQLIQAEKMASLGQLSSGIAHEIRNPLNFVSNFASLSGEILEELESSSDPTEQKESLHDLKENAKKIRKHARRADQIVERLIEQADQAGGVREVFDLNEVVAAAIETAAVRFANKYEADLPELRVEYHDTPLEIVMVRKDIVKVVTNLLDNALYSVYKKGSQDESHKGRVSVKTSQSDGRVSVSVSDNGVGISEETRDKIFEPFFTTRPTGEGTGLGLFLCYQIIAGHYGEIQVSSKDGEGARFEFKLPAEPDTQPSEA